MYLLEDAAQFFSEYKGKPLGTIGDLGTYSVHETKNVISGKGGCLILNNAMLNEIAEIIREKGTNRSMVNILGLIKVHHIYHQIYLLCICSAIGVYGRNH